MTRRRGSFPRWLLLVAPSLLALAGLGVAGAARAAEPTGEVVAFPSGALTLKGVLYRPPGPGPFPAVLYNHGGSPGLLSNEAFEAIGPRFVERGWVFFAPWRRGQGLSAGAGPFIADVMARATRQRLIAEGLGLAALLGAVICLATAGWKWRRRSSTGVGPWLGGLVGVVVFVVAQAAKGGPGLARVLETDHLQDQLAGLAWLRAAPFVAPGRIAVAGNSLGGIEAVLGVEQVAYCAALDASGGAMSWAQSPDLRQVMARAVRHARAPIFFFQAANDFDLGPTRTLSAAMQDAGRPFEMKIYPPFGASPEQGHSFAYAASAVWFDDAFRFLQQHCR